MKKTILIFGSNSDIAKKFVIRNYDKYNFYLISRDIINLNKSKIYLKDKYNIEINIFQYNLTDNKIPSEIIEYLTKCNILLFAAGTLNIEEGNLENFYKVNLTSTIQIIELLLKINKLSNIKQIITLSSIAGERGRAKNYIYGAAKAALTQYFSGLRQKLSKKNIIVSTIKLGFVKTKMTKGKKMNKFLSSDTFEASKLIEKSIKYKKEVIYSKNYYFLSLLIKLIPEFIFKKLNF